MARRAVLTARQREALFALPTDEPALMRHCPQATKTWRMS